MSIPKSKMLSASRAIMAIANKTRESREITHKAIQNQTVNINLQRTENPSVSTTRYTSVPEVQTNSEIPMVVERSVSIEPTVEAETPTLNSTYTEELNSLYNMVNNYEIVAQALILIIDIM